MIRAALGFVSGALWGAIAWAIAARALGSAVLAGVAAAPLVGVAVALAFRHWPRFGRGGRIALALASLYLGAVLFAVAAGFGEAMRDLPPGPSRRIPHEVVLQTVLGTLYGLTLMGWFVPLWPLAYVNHALLARFSRD